MDETPSPSRIDDSAASSPEGAPAAKRTKGAKTATKKRGRPMKEHPKVKLTLPLPRRVTSSPTNQHTEELFSHEESFATDGEESHAEESSATIRTTGRDADASQTEGEDETRTEGEEDETEGSEEEEEDEDKEEEEEEEEQAEEPGEVSQASERAIVTVSSKATGKPKSSARKEISIDKKKKKRRKTPKGTYTMYIFKVFRQLNKDMRISTQSMEIMNSFVNDMFERIVNEAACLAKHNKKHTLGANEIQTATRLAIGYNSLGDHAIAEGMKALAMYKRNSDKE